MMDDGWFLSTIQPHTTAHWADDGRQGRGRHRKRNVVRPLHVHYLLLDCMTSAGISTPGLGSKEAVCNQKADRKNGDCVHLTAPD
jgi:hypothetical protein